MFRLLLIKKCINSYFWICFLVTKFCPTLLQPHDCSPPGFSVHGISQARILEWGAVSYSRRKIPTFQRSNLHLLYWQADSLLLSH